jgi:hypothetical protein
MPFWSPQGCCHVTMWVFCCSKFLTYTFRSSNVAGHDFPSDVDLHG